MTDSSRKAATPPSSTHAHTLDALARASGATPLGDKALAAEREQDVMQFPMEFPLKIMGKSEAHFADTVRDIILKHAPDFDPKTLQSRASKNGSYLSLTATITAQSRAQLDALYQELSAHPMVSYLI